MNDTLRNMIRREIEFNDQLNEKKKEKVLFKKRMKLFFRFFLSLLAIIIITKAATFFSLAYSSEETLAQVNSIRFQHQYLPMDGSVSSFLIEYSFDTPKGLYSAIYEIDSEDIYDYFDRIPKAGALIKIKYVDFYPVMNEIVKTP